MLLSISGPRLRLDALAFEPQFVDHVAPVWRALPSDIRGAMYTSPALVSRAAARGVGDPQPLDVVEVRRRQPSPPLAKPGTGPVAFAASIGDMKVGRRLGYDRFIFIEHGAGQAYDGDPREPFRHPSYAGGMDREDVILFLVPNEYSASRWRAAYPATPTVVVGSPHVGDLPDREPGPGPVVALSFHWPAHIAPEAGTALGHYITVLPDVAREWTTIGHAHPKGDWPQRMERTYRKAGIPTVADFDEVCRRADVYVCDNSSTLFEFAATGRPVVVLNAPMYRRNIHHGLRFWTAARVGINVDSPASLVPAIRAAIADDEPLPTDRVAALLEVYPADDPRGTLAAGRAAEAITEVLRAHGQAVIPGRAEPPRSRPSTLGHRGRRA